MPKEKTYTIVVVCENCEQKTSLEVPKGTTKEEFITTNGALCDNCGCRISQAK